MGKLPRNHAKVRDMVNAIEQRMKVSTKITGASSTTARAFCQDLQPGLEKTAAALQPGLERTAQAAELAKEKAGEFAEQVKPKIIEAHEHARKKIFKAASSAAATAVWFVSPMVSPRGSDGDLSPPCLAEESKDEKELPCDDDSKKQQEELEHQWASLRTAKEEHAREAERAAEEREGWVLAARLQGADMEQHLGASSNIDASELREMRRVQEELSAANAAKAEVLKKTEDALLRKADDLARREELLSHERVELNRSRASLAVVQAHVVSMLDRAQSSGEVVSHSLDDTSVTQAVQEAGQSSQEAAQDVEPRPAPTNTADVWGMDWAGAFQTQDSACASIPPPCSKASVPT